MRDIRIVHITTVSQTLGFVREQMRLMRQMGFSVHAIASRGEYADRICVADGISFHPVEMSRTITPARDLYSLKQLCRVLREINPAVVHAHTPKAGLLGMMAAKLCGIPARIFHVHGAPHLASNGVKRVLLKESMRLTCHLACRVLCVSHSVGEAIIADRTCNARKLHVPANGSAGGVDAEGLYSPSRFDSSTRQVFMKRHNIPPGSLVMAFVGRIVRDKGLVELAAAWRQLRERHPTLYFAVAGDLESQDPVPAEVVTMLAEDPRIRSLGWLDDLSAFYASIDLLVLPSYREGFPNSPLEASAMGVPVVSTIVPGCTDAVVDGVTGLLVPPRDAVALAGAIERYVLDPELRRLHGRAGRLRAIRDFRPLPIHLDIHRHYRELLASCGISVPAPPEVPPGEPTEILHQG